MKPSPVQHKEADKEMAAGVIVWRPTIEGPRFLILYHGHNYWNFPKGKIEKEEKSFQAALRETREETGLGSRELAIESNFTVRESFTFKRRGRKVYKTVIFYLAKTQKRWIRISKEHQGFGWFTYREAIKLFPSEKHKDTRLILKQAYDFLCNNEQTTTTDQQCEPESKSRPE